ncbi:unnamed protein product, partial [Ranitomeya imitator]
MEISRNRLSVHVSCLSQLRPMKLQSQTAGQLERSWKLGSLCSLFDLRQRTAAQRNLSVSTPVNTSQGTSQVPGMLAATPGLQRDTSAPGGPPERTAQPGLQSGLVQRRPGSPATAISGMGVHPPGPPLARPILPRERGAVDRVIEYLVGDGPQNRYALICQQCFSHNGMALKEEFEYVAFRCAYCYFLNPARKTRPQAPRLQELNLERMPRSDSQSSTSISQAVTEELENQTSSDPSEVEETPDAEDVLGEEEKSTELPDETLKEGSQAVPEEVVPPTNVNEGEESLMETEDYFTFEVTLTGLYDRKYPTAGRRSIFPAGASIFPASLLSDCSGRGRDDAYSVRGALCLISQSRDAGKMEAPERDAGSCNQG